MKAVYTVVLLLLVSFAARPVVAFDPMGHHVIAVLAFEELGSEQQVELLEILRALPDFEKHFKPPARIANDPAAVSRWQIGIAGCWPEKIRGDKKFDRPTWHYVPGKMHSIGHTKFMASIFRISKLPADTTLEAQELNATQAITLCSNVFKDKASSEVERAIAACWLIHLIAELHQPCSCGSLYSEKAFPDGDNHGNLIKFKNGSTLNAVWNSSLGEQANPEGIKRLMEEIRADPETEKYEPMKHLVTQEYFSPEMIVLLIRSRDSLFVYPQFVCDAINQVERGEAKNLEPIELTEEYSKWVQTLELPTES